MRNKPLTREQLARMTPAERFAYLTEGMREIGEASQRFAAACDELSKTPPKFVEVYGAS